MIFADGTRLHVEIAETDRARARGLMFRNSLADEEGMLFRFEVPRCYAFWMKNVRFALDIIWLDTNGRIVWIEERAAPCPADPCPMYRPATDASYVLEVVGGFVQRHGVAVGDAVDITRLP